MEIYFITNSDELEQIVKAETDGARTMAAQIFGAIEASPIFALLQHLESQNAGNKYTAAYNTIKAAYTLPEYVPPEED